MLDGIDTVNFSAGEVIFKEGDAPGSVYIIDIGRVTISRHDGKRDIVLGERKAEDVFGEMALVDNMPRSATATAAEDTRCYVINEATFSQYIQELNPIVYHVFRSMSQTIREQNETHTLLSNVLQVRSSLT